MGQEFFVGPVGGSPCQPWDPNPKIRHPTVPHLPCTGMWNHADRYGTRDGSTCPCIHSQCHLSITDQEKLHKGNKVNVSFLPRMEKHVSFVHCRHWRVLKALKKSPSTSPKLTSARDCDSQFSFTLVAILNLESVYSQRAVHEFSAAVLDLANNIDVAHRKIRGQPYSQIYSQM